MRTLAKSPFLEPLANIKVPLEKFENDIKFTLNATLIDALVVFSGITNQLSTYKLPESLNNVGIGVYQSPNSDNGEIIIIEAMYSTNYDCELIEIFFNQDNQLQLRASRFVDGEYRIYENLEDVGTPSFGLYLGIVYTLMQNPSFSKEVKDFVENANLFIRELNKAENSDELISAVSLGYMLTDSLKKAINSIGCDTFLGDDIPFLAGESTLKDIDIKVFAGEFKHIPQIHSKYKILKDDLYSLNFYKAYEDFSQEEKLLVPSIPETHVISGTELFIAKELKNSFDCDDESLKIHNVLAEGEAGSGKSQLVRVLASRMKRPYLSFSCSSNTEECDIKGMLLPCVAEEERSDWNIEDQKLYSFIIDTPSEDITQKMAEYLNLPALDDIIMDPNLAFEQIANVMGIAKQNITDPYFVLEMRDNFINSKIKKIIQLASTHTDAVQYKYIESPIVRAIKNGYVLEIQEIAMVKNQSVFSCLFDVLERSSIGVLQTHNGEIYRHPDFFCFATTNARYHGCKPLNQALRSRFQLVAKMESPNEDEIIERLEARTDIHDNEVLKTIALVFLLLKEKAKDLRCDGELSMRALFQFAISYKATTTQQEVLDAVKHYLIWPLTTEEEEFEELYDIFSSSFILKPYKTSVD